MPLSEPLRPRYTLKRLLILAFVPLTGIPLLLLCAVTYFLVGRTLDQELAKRAAPELSALARNLETAERRLGKQLGTLARGEGFLEAVMVHDLGAVGRETRKWIEPSLFERVRVYDADGTRLYDLRRTDLEAAEIWEGVFDTKASNARRRQPSSKGGGGASFAELGNREGEAGELKSDFRKFLRSEDNWVLRRADRTDGFGWAVYRAVLDSDFKTAGFVEAEVRLTPERLKVLADYQGVDLAMIAPDRAWSAASDPLVGQAFAAYRANFDAAADLKVDGVETSFFFTPLTNENGDLLAWISVGLSKAEQAGFLRQILGWVSLLAIALAALVTWMTVLISHRITQPVEELLGATEKMRAGEWVEPVHHDSKTEIGLLVRRFNDMANNVQVTKRMLETKLDELALTHDDLTLTQGQLVQSAKMSSLGQLVAGVAHELNNPIAFIYSNMSQMRTYLRNLEQLDGVLKSLREHLPELDRADLDRALVRVEWDYIRTDMRDIVQSCLEGSIRVKDIVLGLRNFSRADRGDRVEFDLHRSLEETAKLLSGQAKNRVELHWALASTGRMKGNRSQVDQVLVNLLANALQAIEGRGHVWIRTRDFAHSELGDCIEMKIRDDGQGIAPDHLNKIFDPFFTTKKVGDGTGLGLSIVYGIVQRHGGRIEVQSRTAADGVREGDAVGRGTEFTVYWPLGPLPSAAGTDDEGVRYRTG